MIILLVLKYRTELIISQIIRSYFIVEKNLSVIKVYERDLINVPLKYNRCVGIDGSFQLIGGAGGTWYAPISVVRILFEDITNQPSVDVFWANIEEIEEYPKIVQTVENVKEERIVTMNPNSFAENYMLNYETKALFNWGTRNQKSYVLLDGPIVDPPNWSIGGNRTRRRRGYLKSGINIAPFDQDLFWAAFLSQICLTFHRVAVYFELYIICVLYSIIHAEIL